MRDGDQWGLGQTLMLDLEGSNGDFVVSGRYTVLDRSRIFD